MPKLLTLFLITLTVVTVACGSTSNQPASSGKLSVVTTVAPITSIVENIGGNRIHLQGIVPEGTNSHTYEPSPSIAKILTKADIIIANGLFLEEPTLNLAESVKRDDTPILLLGDNTISRDQWAFDFTFPESGQHPNPHLWPDPNLALLYAQLVHDSLVSLDPSNRDHYDDNLASFTVRIDLLDNAIREGISTIPPDNRRLLTYHDSWAYFARTYDVEIIGAIQPSDFSEPSPQEMARLILQVRDLGVPAVFGSEVFPSKALEQIAREAGALYSDELADDDLPGLPGDPDHSYLGLMTRNMITMVGALGGDVSPFHNLDSSLVFEGPSTAIYPQ